ncbi:MAG: tetratricopeptide repeat protein [Acidobacteriales bacterium]|nr:tetratricopeptide repeat protein [Terriglobales bacterium]
MTRSPEPAGSGHGGASDRLDSWKEIAAYLNRGARTVQRWEREEGLPVHRLQHDKLGSVHAYRAELDAWWTGRQTDLATHVPERKDLELSIAVLPFADLSQQQDQGYFCEGIAEEVLNALSRIQGLRVASRTSAFRFRERAADIADIGRKLKVRALLEGSVRKSGERLRIAVQLSDTDSGYQLWSQAFDREFKDIFAIQEEIARRVAQELEVTLSPKETAALKKTPTSNTEAYDFYLRGRSYYYRYSPRDVSYATGLFMRAVERDGAYALAFAGMADCWSYLYLYSERNPALLDQADWASAKAVELDPESAQAHASRAVVLSVRGRDQEATAAFETALRLDPNLFEAHYFYARHAFTRGEREKAIQRYEAAMRLRPEDYQAPLLVAQTYDDLGRSEEARACRLKGIAAAEQHLALHPDDARALYMAANGMVALGERERGRDWAQRALAAEPDNSMLLYNVGCIYSMLDLVDDAVDCLERAVAGGLTQKGWYEHDSNLDAVRSHPRFQALLGRLA